MKTIKSAVKKALSTFLTYESLERMSDIETLAGCWLSPVYRESCRRLRTFRNRHEGERCFIIGNGPSLNKMDLTPLKDEITFGLNRIYLLFEKMGFHTTYFVSVNQYVIQQSAEEIERLNSPKFIRWDSREHINFDSDTIFIRSRSGPRFCHDVSRQGVWEGMTVTYVAMQLAYYMGFSEVILIGVDHNFKTKGEPSKLVVSKGDDPDHFDPDYFGKDINWQLPDLETSEKAYTLAKKAYLNSGRKILDATVGGKLTIFPKVRYEDILSALSSR
jgi:hypothetical protein